MKQWQVIGNETRVSDSEIEAMARFLIRMTEAGVSEKQLSFGPSIKLEVRDDEADSDVRR